MRINAPVFAGYNEAADMEKTKSKSLIKITFAVILLSLNFLLTGIVRSQEPTRNSNCRGAGCGAISRAELFIKTFGGSKGLRTSQFEQEEKVRLAFYGIDATRVETEAGRLTEKEGNFIIDGHEQVIRDYLHDKGSEAKIAATSGQVSDIPAVRKSLGGLLSVAKQDALRGHEELAQTAQEIMVTTLVTFSRKFAETCQQQKYPVETALEIEVQNEKMGTGVSLEHCQSRKASVELTSQGVKYRFETCRDVSHPKEEWKLKMSGRVVGEGKGDDGFWEANFLWKGIKNKMGGEMEIFDEEIEVQEESVKIPDDAGPNAKPNGWASAPVPNPPSRPKRKVVKMRIAPLLLIADRAVQGNYTEGSVEAEIKRDDPCDPAT